jgi:Na+/H+ antiporter NhaD/arsenite permease-like protein
MDLTLAIFFFVYLAMGVGHLPGLRVDRTGAALIGAMLLVALGRISPDAAWDAVDYRTIGLLFGLMVISAALVVAGFYAWVARKVSDLQVGPKALLAIIILVATGMSSLLTKDIVAVAMTPVFCSICVSRRLNPVPFLLGFCFATNVGSVGTLTGSPQNMIVAETLHLSFTDFVRAAALPSLLGLPVIWAALVLRYRGKWHLPAASGSVADQPSVPDVALDTIGSIKAILILVAVIAAFILSDWPHMLIALLGASALLASRRVSSTTVLAHVNGNLLVLLFGLFILNAAFSATGVPGTASRRDARHWRRPA